MNMLTPWGHPIATSLRCVLHLQWILNEAPWSPKIIRSWCLEIPKNFLLEISLWFQVRAGDGNLSPDEAAHHARDEEQLQGRRYSWILATICSIFWQFSHSLIFAAIFQYSDNSKWKLRILGFLCLGQGKEEWSGGENHQVVILKSEIRKNFFTNEYKLEQMIRIEYKCVQRCLQKKEKF